MQRLEAVEPFYQGGLVSLNKWPHIYQAGGTWIVRTLLFRVTSRDTAIEPVVQIPHIYLPTQE